MLKGYMGRLSIHFLDLLSNQGRGGAGAGPSSQLVKGITRWIIPPAHHRANTEKQTIVRRPVWKPELKVLAIGILKLKLMSKFNWGTSKKVWV